WRSRRQPTPRQQLREEVTVSCTPPSNGHRRLDMRVRIVAGNEEVLVLELEDGHPVRVERHLRQRPRRAPELLAGLLEMVGVEMDVAKRVDELAGFKARDLRHHLKQQSIGRDVERHAKK